MIPHWHMPKWGLACNIATDTLSCTVSDAVQYAQDMALGHRL
jgi:hypothetical protein